MADALTDHAETNPHLVEDQSQVECFLASPATYGPSVDHVDRIDTYGAMLFLTGDHVIKIKRAVRYPYMDFSTLEKRKAACANELKLNRRTAPDVYVGLCSVYRAADGDLVLNLDGYTPPDGTILEWGVHMRRFDESQRLDHLAERGQLDDRLLKGLADQIADFHESAEVRTTDPDFLAAVEKIVRENTEAFLEFPKVFPGDRVAAMDDRLSTVIAAYADRLRKRQTDGLVRHCHGDLHLANLVCLNDRPTLFDALEFDDDMARIDVYYDLAFLLMDLCERGYRQSANIVLNQYLARTSDFDGLALLPLFLSIRAAIRAKIAAAQHEADKAETYFSFAENFLTPPAPRLIAIGGLSGSGKSTLARALAPKLGAAPGAVHVRSDVIRKRLFKVDETTRLDNTAYSSEVNRRVYQSIQDAAQAALENGHSVIADAVYANPEEREGIHNVANRCGVPFTGIWLDAPPQTLTSRVEHRIGDASDADATVVQKQLARNIGEIDWTQVSSETAFEKLLQKTRQLIDGDEESINT